MIKYGILNQYADRVVLPLVLENDTGVMILGAVGLKLPKPDPLEELIADWKQRGLIPGPLYRLSHVDHRR